MTNFEKIKEELPSKGNFYSLLTDKKLVAKNMNLFLMFGKKLKLKKKEKLSPLVYKL